MTGVSPLEQALLVGGVASKSNAFVEQIRVHSRQAKRKSLKDAIREIDEWGAAQAEPEFGVRNRPPTIDQLRKLERTVQALAATKRKKNYLDSAMRWTQWTPHGLVLGWGDS